MLLRSLWVVVLSATMASGSALAGAPTRDYFDRLPPPLRGEAAKKLAAQQKRATPRTGSLDTTAPRVTILSVSSGFDADRPTGGLTLNLVASDDLSGLDQVYVTWQHQVTGQSQNAWLKSGLGRKEYRESGRMILANVGMAPGPWKMVEALGWDMAGNVFYYDQDQLAALGGNLSFDVRNHLYEASAPTLVRGTILATSVSRSTPWPGTVDAPQLLTVDLTALEPKTTRMSGLSYATMRLCTDTEASCLDLFGSDLLNRAEVQLTLGTKVQPGDALGTYHLHSLSIYDTLSNRTDYLSTRFGGETDFSRYFPVTQVEITP